MPFYCGSPDETVIDTHVDPFVRANISTSIPIQLFGTGLISTNIHKPLPMVEDLFEAREDERWRMES
jgi:hypothetical protein